MKTNLSCRVVVLWKYLLSGLFVHLHLQRYCKHLHFFFVCNSKRIKNPYVEMYMLNNNWSKECDSLVIEGKKVLQWLFITMQLMKFENYLQMFKCDSSWSMNEFVGILYDKVPQWNWINLQLMKFEKYKSSCCWKALW